MGKITRLADRASWLSMCAFGLTGYVSAGAQSQVAPVRTLASVPGNRNQYQSERLRPGQNVPARTPASTQPTVAISVPVVAGDERKSVVAKALYRLPASSSTPAVTRVTPAVTPAVTRATPAATPVVARAAAPTVTPALSRAAVPAVTPAASAKMTGKVVASAVSPSVPNFYSSPSPNYYAPDKPRAEDRPKLVTRLMHPFGNCEPETPRDVSRTSRFTGLVQMGTASWYGSDFHGDKTANGERYDMWSLTAAHRTLPFGTLIKVTNLSNGNECIVRVNNRGPFRRNRILDLSRGAAHQLGMLGSGLAKVKMEVLGQGG